MANYIFNVDGVVMYPNWDDSLIKKGTLIEGEKHKQITLESNLRFVDNLEDYAYLIAQPLDKKINVVIDRVLDSGIIKHGYFTGYFYLTDSEINKDECIITVALTASNLFLELEAYKDVSVQIKELSALNQTRVYTQLPSYLQMYVLGDTKVTNYLGGAYWEQECTQVTEYDGGILQGEGFVGAGFLDGIFEFSGAYIGTINRTDNGAIEKWVQSNGIFELRPVIDGNFIKWAGYRISNNNLELISNQVEGDDPLSLTKIELTEFIFINLPNPTQVANCLEVKRIFTWVISAKNRFDGVDCDDKNTAFCKNEAYQYQIQRSYPQLGLGLFKLSISTQDEPTEYNIAENGRYFSKLTSNTEYDYIPIGNNMWGNFGIWLRGSSAHYELMNSNVVYEFTYGYTIQQLIKALLSYHNISLSYEESSVFSNFLYDTNNPITGDTNLNYIYIPKNNLLGASITVNTPYRDDSISLNDIFTHLKYLLRTFRTIEDGKLRLEHTNWYDKGKTYANAEQIQKDLTILFQPQNSLSLAYGINTFKFEKQSTIKTYRYGYNSASKIFNGKDIEVVSDGVLNGQESRETTGLSNDISYVRINSQDEVREGFAIVACSETFPGGYNEVLNYSLNIGGYYYQLQNIFMSIPNLQVKFATLDIPFNKAIINGVEVEVDGISKIKYHDTVEYAIKDLENDPDLYKFVKTAEGNGEITEMQLNLGTRTVKLKLNYDINS